MVITATSFLRKFNLWRFRAPSHFLIALTPITMFYCLLVFCFCFVIVVVLGRGGFNISN